MDGPRTLPQVVEIRQHGEVTAVAAVEDEGGRLRGVDVHGRWTRLPAARVLCWTGVAVDVSTPERAAEALRAYVADQERRRADVDLEALWERSREALPRATLQELAALLFPDAGGRERALVLRAVVMDGLRFRVRADDVEVRSQEQVEQAQHEQREAARREALRTEVVAWLRGDRPGPPEAGEPLLESLRLLAAQQGQPPARDPGVRLLKDAGLPTTPAGAFKVLRQRGVFRDDENLLLIRHGLGRPFSQAVTDDAEALAAAPLRVEGRRDLRALRVVSIDDDETTEVDDALSLERLDDGGVRVGVHLAEPGARVPPGSRTDREAARRQTTLYLADARHLMLPPVLAEQACSLLPREDRPALSVLLTYDAAGQEVGHEIVPSLVCVDEAVPYDVADARLRRGSDPLLAALSALAERLRQERIAAGALETALVEVYPVADDRGEVMLQEFEPDTPAHKLVSEWMVRANHAAARFCLAREVPVPYRHQALHAPFPEQLDLADRHDVFRATRCLGQTRLDLRPRRHHGLALDAYVQATSPLRRYLDLVTQRQLAAAAAGTPPPLDAEGLQRVLKDAEPVLSRAQITAAGTRDYWMIRWLEEQLGEVFDAVVLEQQGNRVRLVLLDLGYRLTWKPPQQLRAGERVRLRVVEADARAGRVRVQRAGDG